jgi:hypothetical protein
VARVINFLDDLGKEDVQQKKRRGKKIIVIDPKAATRYAAHHDCYVVITGRVVRPTLKA